jgi:hypothetical protein
MSDWKLAQRDKIRAYRSSELLLIVAEGTAPESCFEIDIARNAADKNSHEYVLQWRRAKEKVCSEVLTPYKHPETFRDASDMIRVRHADGYDDVRVQGADDKMGNALRLLAKGDGPFPMRNAATGLVERGAEGRTREGIGHSDGFLLEEAVRAAVANLNKGTTPQADRLDSVEIVGMYAVMGGFVGFRRLIVRVRPFVVPTQSGESAT